MLSRGSISDPSLQLIAAVKDNDFKGVHSLLQRGANPRVTDSNSLTALHWAAERGSEYLTALLLEYPSQINARSSTGRIPLHLASFGGHSKIVSLLAMKGADVNARNVDGRTPLHMAAYNGHDQTVSILISHGADASVQDNDGKTPMDWAMRGDQEEGVRSVLQAAGGTTKQARDRAQASAGSREYQLWTAARGGDSASVMRLLDDGIDAGLQDASGLTAMHFASQHGHDDVISLLIAGQASVNALTTVGVSPLHMAAHGGHRDTCALLLKNGALVDARDSWGRLPLHMAAWEKQGDVVALLLEHNSDVNLASNQGNAALHMAVAEKPSGSPRDIVKKLLAHGARPLQRNRKGESPADICGAAYEDLITSLGGTENESSVAVGVAANGRPLVGSELAQRRKLFSSAREGDVAGVQALLGAGTDPTSRDKNGMTALHWAAHRGQREVVRALLQAAVHVDTRTNEGKSALHYAAYEGHAGVVEELLSFGADTSARNNDSRTPLQMAAYNMSEECVTALIEAGADASELDKDGATALHWVQKRCDDVLALLEQGMMKNSTGPHLLAAVQRREYRPAKRLLELGTDPNTRDSKGKTVLHWAVDSRHDEAMSTVSLLLKYNADATVQDNDGWTALMWAAGRGLEVCVYQLLLAGSPIDCKNSDGRTALHVATFEDHVPVVELLLKHGASLEADLDGKTPQDWACSPEMVAAFSAVSSTFATSTSAADPPRMSTSAHAPLVTSSVGTARALPWERAAELSERSSRRASRPTVGESQRSPFPPARHAAPAKAPPSLFPSSRTTVKAPVTPGPLSDGARLVTSSQMRFAPTRDGPPADVQGDDVPQTLKSGRVPAATAHFSPQISSADNPGDALLWSSAADGDLEGMQKALLAGANPDSKDAQFGRTALHWAAANDRLQAVHELVRRRVSVDSATNDGRTALHWAAERGHFNVVQVLVDADALLNVRSLDGATPLHLACRHGHESVAMLLLDRRCDVNARNVTNGDTPLMEAVVANSVETVRLLLRTPGFDVNLQNNEGSSALHLACGREQSDLVEALCAVPGIQASLKDSAGAAPLHLALIGLLDHQSNEHEIGALLDAGADPNMLFNSAERGGLGAPLHYSALYGHMTVTRALLELGADPNVQNFEGNVPLHYAADKGYEDAVSLLLDWRATASIRNLDGDTPADWAQTESLRALLVSAG